MMNFIFSLLWRFYASWSNFYSWIESKIYLDNEGLLRIYNDSEYRTSSPSDAWRFYVDEFLALKHYGRDKWYMGFDAMSSPVRFANRGEGDCDDFAVMALHFFGNKFAVDHKKKTSCEYVFDGFYCMKFDTIGHCCAVWRTTAAAFPKMLVVNNDSVLLCGDEEDFVRRFSVLGRLDLIGVLTSKNGKLAYDRMYVVENDKMRRV